jgi:hypothetical protein
MLKPDITVPFFCPMTYFIELNACWLCYILIGSFPRFSVVALEKVVRDGWMINVVGNNLQIRNLLVCWEANRISLYDKEYLLFPLL